MNRRGMNTQSSPRSNPWLKQLAHLTGFSHGFSQSPCMSVSKTFYIIVSTITILASIVCIALATMLYAALHFKIDFPNMISK